MDTDEEWETPKHHFAQFSKNMYGTEKTFVRRLGMTYANVIDWITVADPGFPTGKDDC